MPHGINTPVLNYYSFLRRLYPENSFLSRHTQGFVKF